MKVFAAFDVFITCRKDDLLYASQLVEKKCNKGVEGILSCDLWRYSVGGLNFWK